METTTQNSQRDELRFKFQNFVKGFFTKIGIDLKDEREVELAYVVYTYCINKNIRLQFLKDNFRRCVDSGVTEPESIFHLLDIYANK